MLKRPIDLPRADAERPAQVCAKDIRVQDFRDARVEIRAAVRLQGAADERGGYQISAEKEKPRRSDRVRRRAVAIEKERGRENEPMIDATLVIEDQRIMYTLYKLPCFNLYLENSHAFSL